jgi:hypothetical protein
LARRAHYKGQIQKKETTMTLIITLSALLLIFGATELKNALQA